MDDFTKKIRALQAKYAGFEGAEWKDIPEDKQAAYKEELGELMSGPPGPPTAPKPCTLCDTMAECCGIEGVVMLGENKGEDIFLCLDCRKLMFTDSKEYWRRWREKYAA